MYGNDETLKQNIAMKGRKQYSIFCVGMFAVYAILTLIGALRHESWFDEVQAWSIARDNTIPSLFGVLKYEGHPPLWFLLLHLLSKLGFGCEVLPLVSWFFSMLGAGFFLWKAPFGIGMKAATLFSASFLYFNTVISRVYCLIPLLLGLLAWLYPARKQHPVWYGVLLALLANTHVCMCGLIGVLGIYMLIDLAKGWKAATGKQRACSVLGLLIAAGGVLCLVLPLLTSTMSNVKVAEKEFSVMICMEKLGRSLISICYDAISGSLVFWFLPIAALLSMGIVALLVLFRHWRRPFWILLGFLACYVITTQIMWVPIPNRSTLFFFVLVVLLWITEAEPYRPSSGKDYSGQVSAKWMQKLVQFLTARDVDTKHTCTVLLSLLLATTIPHGAMYLVQDYGKDFCKSETAAAYILEHLPEDAVFVVEDEAALQLSAYLPGYRFYVPQYEAFATYVLHQKLIDEPDADKIKKDLQPFSNLYYIKIYAQPDMPASNRNIVYTARGHIPYGVNYGYLEISTFDLKKDLGMWALSEATSD